MPDLEKTAPFGAPKTKESCINNPNNPTGALMSEQMLREIVEIARSADAWILCDEVYRHLSQEDGWCPSIVELYEKGISMSSMSKFFFSGWSSAWLDCKARYERCKELPFSSGV